MEEIQRWMTSPTVPIPSSSNDHQPPPQQQQQRAPFSPPRREPSPRRSSPPRRQDTLSPSYQRYEPPLSTEESLLKQTSFFSPVLPIVTPPLDRKGSVNQRSEQTHDTHNTSTAPPLSSQQQQQPAPPPQVIYIQMPPAPATAAPPPPPPPPAPSQPSVFADRKSPVPPPREPSPSPQTIPRAPTTAQAPNPPLYRPSAITPPMQRQPTITRPQPAFPPHFRPQTGPPVQDRAASRMTSVSAIGGDERDINMDIWKAPSQQTGVPTGMGPRTTTRANPRPGPQPRTGQHTQQASWSTVGRGGSGTGFGGGFGIKGKGKERAAGDGLFGGDYQVLGPATKRNSKYPIHPVEVHPSRNRDAEVEYYPEPKDYTEVDKDWEAVQRSLKSLPPSDSSAGGSYYNGGNRNCQGLGSPLFGRDAPLGGKGQGHQRDDSRASSFRIAGPPGRVVVPPRPAPPPVQATPLRARTPVGERSRSRSSSIQSQPSRTVTLQSSSFSQHQRHLESRSFACRISSSSSQSCQSTQKNRPASSSRSQPPNLSRQTSTSSKRRRTRSPSLFAPSRSSKGQVLRGSTGRTAERSFDVPRLVGMAWDDGWDSGVELDGGRDAEGRRERSPWIWNEQEGFGDSFDQHPSSIHREIARLSSNSLPSTSRHPSPTLRRSVSSTNDLPPLAALLPNSLNLRPSLLPDHPSDPPRRPNHFPTTCCSPFSISHPSEHPSPALSSSNSSTRIRTCIPKLESDLSTSRPTSSRFRSASKIVDGPLFFPSHRLSSSSSQRTPLSYRSKEQTSSSPRERRSRPRRREEEEGDSSDSPTHRRSRRRRSLPDHFPSIPTQEPPHHQTIDVHSPHPSPSPSPNPTTSSSTPRPNPSPRLASSIHLLLLSFRRSQRSSQGSPRSFSTNRRRRRRRRRKEEGLPGLDGFGRFERFGLVGREGKAAATDQGWGRRECSWECDPEELSSETETADAEWGWDGG
ncbi:hypothetical protein BDY24DRAFT_159643 [Mrakia frigida]|uniref:uncharacterized protein n=1 Tax=Mrakia frigida TaxID=29902 RepID=UPI003FCC12C4